MPSRHSVPPPADAANAVRLLEATRPDRADGRHGPWWAARGTSLGGSANPRHTADRHAEIGLVRAAGRAAYPCEPRGPVAGARRARLRRGAERAGRVSVPERGPDDAGRAARPR